MNVKKWTKRIGTALCALWLVLPMPVLAAGKDGITFEKRDGGRGAAQGYGHRMTGGYFV